MGRSPEDVSHCVAMRTSRTDTLEDSQITAAESEGLTASTTLFPALSFHPERRGRVFREINKKPIQRQCISTMHLISNVKQVIACFESKPSGALHPLAPAERPWKGDVFGTSQGKGHLGWGFLSRNL